jgi:ribosomal small subunit protein bTHX
MQPAAPGAAAGYAWTQVFVSVCIYNKELFMGRGDKRTCKGKIFAGSWGKSRPAHHNRKNKPPVQAATTRTRPAPREKAKP